VTPEISIVVPAYNEEESLPVLVDEIHAALADRAFELIVVDDGSTDRTLALATDLARRSPSVRVVRLTRNSGQSAALAAGWRAARGTVVVTLDADLQNDPAEIPRLLAKLEEGWDVVSGVRQNRQDTWVRLASSRIANRVRNWATHDQVTDVGCTLRAARREFLTDLPMFNGMHRFLPTLLKMQGARTTEIPVHHRARRFGVAKYGIGNRLFRAVADLLAVRWMQKRWIDFRRAEELDITRGTGS
jgi:glycosyltransferase involved in cell wall biosynthesis